MAKKRISTEQFATLPFDVQINLLATELAAMLESGTPIILSEIGEVEGSIEINFATKRKTR